jgi:hypothetical protein
MAFAVVVVVASADGSADFDELLHAVSRAIRTGRKRKRRTAKVRRAPHSGSNLDHAVGRTTSRSS